MIQSGSDAITSLDRAANIVAKSAQEPHGPIEIEEAIRRNRVRVFKITTCAQVKVVHEVSSFVRKVEGDVPYRGDSFERRQKLVLELERRPIVI